MNDIQLGTIEEQFAGIIWDNEPISSGELAKKSEKTLSWKKTTSYTVLKRLCEKGLFKNENRIVTSLISREEFNSMRSANFVDQAFDGSLPAFFTAFTARKKISPEEIAELKKMIDEYGK